MIETLARVATPVLSQPMIRRIRRNHGLEHATVHMLARRVNNLSVAGRSDAGGFWLLGDLSTEYVTDSVREALRRMQSGEHHLAIHPNCGTSLLTTGSMVGMAALIGSVGVKRGVLDYMNRFPTVVLMSIVAILASRGVGLKLQEHFTTLGDPSDLRVINIERKESRGPLGGKLVLHRVTTESS